MADNEPKSKTKKNIIKEAENSILLTLYMGFFLGIIPVIGFPINIPEMGGRILFIGIILGIAAFISAFFTGTLFGMPKRNNNKESDYTLNNSLVEISEWLTKIIVGLGLVNLKEIPGYLTALGKYVRTSTNYDGQLLDIYSIGIVIYFGFFGLYIGYNYMRLVLSNKYKNADNDLIGELEMAKKVIQIKDMEINQSQNLVEEKEKLTHSLLNMVNENELSMSSTSIETNNENAKIILDAMIENAQKKLIEGLKQNNQDPQKGQWKSKAINNERELKGTFDQETQGLYKINLKVLSTNPTENPLIDGEYILFALHNTFGKEPFKLVKIHNQSAELSFYCYGSFTVGAFADNGSTELELDLAELPGATPYFKTH